jgi:hypothetical protein
MTYYGDRPEHGESLILNETTMRLHKRGLGPGEFQTARGHLDHVGQEKLRTITPTELGKKDNTGKCGQCLEEGGRCYTGRCISS